MVCGWDVFLPKFLSGSQSVTTTTKVRYRAQNVQITAKVHNASLEPPRWPLGLYPAITKEMGLFIRKGFGGSK